MATLYYFNQFDNETVGSLPANFVSLQSTGTLSVQSTGAIKGPQSLGGSAVTTTATTNQVLYTAKASLSNQSVSHLTSYTASGVKYAGLIICSSSDNQNQYVATLENGTNLNLYKRAAGTFTSLLTAAHGLTLGTLVRMRLERNGNVVRAKVWNDGTVEPSAWTVSTTDTSYMTGAQGLYFAAGSAATSAIYVDEFAVQDVYAVGAYNDFESETVGALPSGWIAQQSTGTLAVQSTGAIKGTQSFGGSAITTTATTNEALFPGQGSLSNQSLSYVTSYISTANKYAAAVICSSSDFQNQYLMTLESGTNCVLYKRVNGTFTSLGSGAHGLNLSSTTAVRLRLDRNGTTLRGRAWIDGTTEPTTWTVSVTDTTYTTGMQGLYFTATAGVASPIYVDEFNVTDVYVAPLVFGTGSLSYTQQAGVPTLSLSSAAINGTAPYTYNIYRSQTDPHFTPAAGNLVASGTSIMPWTDTAPVSARDGWFYKMSVVDSSATPQTYYPIPHDLGAPTFGNPLCLTVPAPIVAAYNATRVVAPQPMIYIAAGDSITYGSTTTTPGGSTASSFQCSQALLKKQGISTVAFSNQGHSGHATSDFLPATNTDYPAMKSAATTLVNANPSAMVVFGLMLGTNDTNTGVSAATYVANMTAIVNQICTDFPSAYVVVHEPTWYAPNTHNSATYEEAGLSLLLSYRAALEAALPTITAAQGGRVVLGDTAGWAYLAANYASAMTGESGSNGVFFLHPNNTGAVVLGQLWADAVYSAVFKNSNAGSAAAGAFVIKIGNVGVTQAGQMIAIV